MAGECENQEHNDHDYGVNGCYQGITDVARPELKGLNLSSSTYLARNYF
jgi:hypothetical protein